tara:strand:+ start:6713 stop:7096 length:384 start_codon:yes stop_codon:yes gene_type:complete
MEIEKKISYTLLEKLFKNVQSEKLGNGRCNFQFNYFGVVLIPVSAVSSFVEGIISVKCVAVIPLKHYQGVLKPLATAEHQEQINLGNRERGNLGRIFTIENMKYVIISPEYVFTPFNKKSPVQIGLF